MMTRLLLPMVLAGLAGCANSPGQQNVFSIHDISNGCVLVSIDGASPSGGTATASPPINVSGLPGAGGLPFAAAQAVPTTLPGSTSQTCNVTPAPPAAAPSSAGSPAAEPVPAAATRRAGSAGHTAAPAPVRIIAVPAQLSDSPFYFVHGPQGPLVHYRESPL